MKTHTKCLIGLLLGSSSMFIALIQSFTMFVSIGVMYCGLLLVIDSMDDLRFPKEKKL